MWPAVCGPQHARVPPSRFPIAHDSMPPAVRHLLALRPDTAVVLVGDGMLDIRFGRFRLCTGLANLADVATGEARLSRSMIGFRLCPLGHGLILGTCRTACSSPEALGSVRVRFRHAVSTVGPAVVLRTRWVAIATAGPTDLVAALAGSTLTQVVDTSAPGTAYPVVADPFFGIRLIGTVRNVWGPRGLTYSVQPTAYGRAAAEWIHARHGWPEARSKGVDNRQGLYEQYMCHPISGLARVKSTWNLDTWRPTVGLARTIWPGRCNP